MGPWGQEPQSRGLAVEAWRHCGPWRQEPWGHGGMGPWGPWRAGGAEQAERAFDWVERHRARGSWGHGARSQKVGGWPSKHGDIEGRAMGHGSMGPMGVEGHGRAEQAERAERAGMHWGL